MDRSARSRRVSGSDRIRQEVIEIVAGIAEVEVGEVSDDSTLEALGVDSLGGLRIVAAVEKRYGIVIDEAEIGRIRSIPDIFALVERQSGSE